MNILETNQVSNNKVSFWLYLTHLDYGVIQSIILNSGWSSIHQYQTYDNKNVNKYKCFFENGKIFNILPEFTEEEKKNVYIFNVNLRDLDSSIKEYICSNIICMPLHEFEISDSYTEEIFFYIFKKPNTLNLYNTNTFTFNSDNITTIEKESYEEDHINNTIPNTEYVSDHNSKDTISFDSEKSIIEASLDDIDKNIHILSGYVFKLNKETGKSYILYPLVTCNASQESPINSKGWKLFKNYRNIYYNKKYKGWVVGLSKKNEMIELGAIQI